MSDFSFQIVADGTAAKRALDEIQAELDDTGKAAKKAADTISLEFEDAAKKVKNDSLGEKATEWIGKAAGVGILHGMVELSDKWTELTNTALKFADAGHSANMVLEDQTALAHDLGLSIEQTIGAYDNIRDATDDLNLTYGQQIKLTKNLSEAGILSGKSAEAAAGAFQQLTAIIDTGGDASRSLRTILVQYPDLFEAISKGTGKSRQELFAMAKAGQLTSQLLATGLANAGDGLEKFNQRTKTFGQTMSALKDELFKSYDIQEFQKNGLFGTADQAIQRLISDSEKLTAQWSDMEARIVGGKVVDATGALTKGLTAIGDLTTKLVENPLQTIDPWYVSKDTKAKVAANNKELSETEKLLEEIYGDQDKLGRQLAALDQLLIAGTIDAKTYADQLQRLAGVQSVTDSLDFGKLNIGEKAGEGGITGNMLDAAKPVPELYDREEFAKGLADLKNSVFKAQDEMAKRAEDNAKKVTEAWQNGAAQIGGALVGAALKGDKSFQDMARDAETAILRLLFELAAAQIGGPGGAFIGAIGKSFNGFAGGGSFMVGGGGGTDSQLVAFRASPNERVTIETPSQQAARPASGGGATVINNVFDPTALLSVLESRAGQRAVTNVIKAQPGVVRTYLRR